MKSKKMHDRCVILTGGTWALHGHYTGVTRAITTHFGLFLNEKNSLLLAISCKLFYPTEINHAYFHTKNRNNYLSPTNSPH